MKKVLSVSIGSSKRDHSVTLELLGEQFHIWREGTDGNFAAAIDLLRKYDGEVDAYGLGGTGLFFNAAGRVYWLRDGKQFSDAAALTPIVDGMGLKGVVEAQAVRLLEEKLGLSLAGQKVLMTSAVDRWGMAMAFEDAGCEVSYGDLLYSLGVPIIVHGKRAMTKVVRALTPIAVQLPFRWLYPYESDHTTRIDSESKHAELYRQARIIAGDYKYIKQYMPTDMRGKWILTNTTTKEDVIFLKKCGVELLVTTTPRLEGRSFGTNVIEAAMVALDGAKRALPEARYVELLEETGFEPDVLWLQKS